MLSALAVESVLEPLDTAFLDVNDDEVVAR